MGWSPGIGTQRQIVCEIHVPALVLDAVTATGITHSASISDASPRGCDWRD